MNLKQGSSHSALANAEAQVGNSNLEIYVGAGGTTAVLAGIGTLLAGHLAGIKKWRRYSGVSGGSIPTSLAACGYTAKDLLHMALNLDFGDYVDWKRGVFGAPFVSPFRLSRPLKEHRRWHECHYFGLLSTEPLGKFIEDSAASMGMAGKWPQDFYTMATTRYGDPVYFHADGVDVIRQEEKIRLTAQPEPLGLAVRASSTIGGIMVPLAYRGYTLFDGCLSRDAFCPVGIPIRHYGSAARDIVAVRIGEIHSDTIMGKVHKMIRWLWQVPADFHWGSETAGVIEVHPPIQHVATLQFVQSRDQKWLAILLSFQQSLAMLAVSGHLAGEQQLAARELMDSLGYWRDAPPAGLGDHQWLSQRAEKCFAQHQLY